MAANDSQYDYTYPFLNDTYNYGDLNFTYQIPDGKYDYEFSGDIPEYQEPS